VGASEAEGKGGRRGSTYLALRDQEVVFFVSSISRVPDGAYYPPAQPKLPGEFHARPTKGYAMYCSGAAPPSRGETDHGEGPE